MIAIKLGVLWMNKEGYTSHNKDNAVTFDNVVDANEWLNTNGLAMFKGNLIEVSNQ